MRNHGLGLGHPSLLRVDPPLSRPYHHPFLGPFRFPVHSGLPVHYSCSCTFFFPFPKKRAERRPGKGRDKDDSGFSCHAARTCKTTTRECTFLSWEERKESRYSWSPAAARQMASFHSPAHTALVPDRPKA